MSIEYKNNTMHVQCDFCNRKPEIYFGEWGVAWDEAKKDGWRVKKDDPTASWVHACPDCEGESK